MESWKRVVLWTIVAALVFSFAVCQKKVDKAKTTEAPKETKISSAPEETETITESITEQEKSVDQSTEPKAEEEKPVEKPAAEKKQETIEPAKPAEAAPAKPETPVTRDNAAAIIELGKGGRIVIEFYPKDAPNTVDNFIKLTKKGFYNGLTFHRVVPNFVAQGGCPRGDGTGNPGYQIKAEFNSQKHLTGTVAMARSNDPDSAGSQFYICLEPQSFLDGKYTVFGQVIEGMDLVKGIQIGDVMKEVKIVDKASVKK